MKKKLNISVVDIIQKSTSPKNATLQNKTFNKNP
jgi:hypothetical protein